MLSQSDFEHSACITEFPQLLNANEPLFVQTENRKYGVTAMSLTSNVFGYACSNDYFVTNTQESTGKQLLGPGW